uniref:Lipid-binding serum glycoprotein N-terminal domain-containing protein n=1 Tax=Plectus sambesii TaxID=2011161 RepID=A0A914VV11_9BILA
MHRLLHSFAFVFIVSFANITASPLQNSSDDLTLTDGALETAQYVGVQIINELISTVRGFSSTHKILRSGIDGTVKVHDVVARVTRVPDVSVQLKAASMVLLEFNNLDIAMDGKFAGTAGWFSTNGVVHGDMKNMKIVVQSSIVRMPNGQIVVKMDECQTVVGQSKFTIKAQGMLGSLAKNFEGPLNKDVAVKLPNMMCEGLKQIIDKRGLQLFARLLKAPTDKAVKKTEKTETFIKKFKH